MHKIFLFLLNAVFEKYSTCMETILRLKGYEDGRIKQQQLNIRDFYQLDSIFFLLFSFIPR